jgi:hypothetical protein
MHRRGTIEEVLLWERELLKRFYSGRGTVQEALLCERNFCRGFIGRVVQGVPSRRERLLKRSSIWEV